MPKMEALLGAAEHPGVLEELRKKHDINKLLGAGAGGSFTQKKKS